MSESPKQPSRVSRTEACERAIPLAEREQRWLEANKAALDAYNRRVARDGLLADEAGLL
jgi:hypothetical protein